MKLKKSQGPGICHLVKLKDKAGYDLRKFVKQEFHSRPQDFIPLPN